MAHNYSASDYVFQFITIMTGVLIAMLANGMVERSKERELVAQARSMIRREIAANKQDLAATLSGFPTDMQALDDALAFANDMLAAGKTKVRSIQLHFNMADIFDTSWRTAERTAALSHMDYEEVQRYSKLYDFQEFFIAQQRAAVSQLSLASSLLGPGFDPDKPNRADLEIFRERVKSLRAALSLQETFAKRLDEFYDEALKQ
ncbi:MAG TPA: hypothetical protein VEA16_10920 [Vicinamibacterales bacterium]|nr:hypothetical protein [Vicinamibacterales bacterium]